MQMLGHYKCGKIFYILYCSASSHSHILMYVEIHSSYFFWYSNYRHTEKETFLQQKIFQPREFQMSFIFNHVLLSCLLFFSFFALSQCLWFTFMLYVHKLIRALWGARVDSKQLLSSFLPFHSELKEYPST